MAGPRGKKEKRRRRIFRRDRPDWPLCSK